MNGSYSADSSVTKANDTTNPKNPYSSILQLVYDNAYGDPGSNPAAKHNLKTGSQIPVEIIAEVDRKIDDGKPFSGAFQFSDYTFDNNNQPVRDQCVNVPQGIWRVTGSTETNCGGASLF